MIASATPLLWIIITLQLELTRVIKQGRLRFVHGFTNAMHKFHTQGSVYLFKRLGDAFSYQTVLLPGDLTESDSFGRSVSLDNSTLVAGAYLASTYGICILMPLAIFNCIY